MYANENQFTLDPSGSRPLLSIRDSLNISALTPSISADGPPKQPHKRRPQSPFFQEIAMLTINGGTPLPLDPIKRLTPLNTIPNDEEDLHNTLKKAPKISKKLPPAFGPASTKSSSTNSRKIIVGGAQVFLEPLSKIDNLLEAKESKQGVQIPSPQYNKKKLDVNLPESKLLKNLDQKRGSRNPLLPLRNYLILSKMNDEIRENSRELSLDRLDKIVKSHKENQAPMITQRKETHQDQYKLCEMITLGLLSSGNESGTVKKMIHATTLKMFAVKEVPLSTKEIRNGLREWLTQWQTTYSNSPKHLKIYSTSFNSPEGCVSIVMDLMNGGSLQNLLESVGTLPESAIQTISTQTLLALEDVHTKLNTGHGVISPSQILMDKLGNIKAFIIGQTHKLVILS